MTFDEFEQLVARARAEDPSSEYGTLRPATPAQVAAAEQALGVGFPPEYGFEHVGGRCGSQVRFLDHETESLAGPDVAEPYDDLFEFLRDNALEFVD